MCKEFVENRKVLAQIIWDAGEFMPSEIEAKYVQVRPDGVVDGFTTVRGYIKGLEECDILKRKGLRYRVIPPGSRSN
jgi:hypothetical protein